MKERERGLSPIRLILASGSPRRREILRLAGIPFKVLSSDIAEGPARVGENPSAYARRLAREKADSIRGSAPSDAVILAADTIVCVGRSILGKPRSSPDARRMLRQLSGRAHCVITGVALLDKKTGELVVWSEQTRVIFRRLSEHEIRAYLKTGEPFDKAGAYAAQGRAAQFILRIEGCFFNVVGLPLASVCQRLDWLSRRRSARCAKRQTAKRDVNHRGKK